VHACAEVIRVEREALEKTVGTFGVILQALVSLSDEE
jgi:hypothetical protein